jgi:caffeoyl-CoA O-methyltransferase
MKRVPFVVVLALVGATLTAVAAGVGWGLHALYAANAIVAPSRASTEGEAAILGALEDLQRSGGTFLSVPESDGRTLRLLVEAIDARNVVEVGTSTGYSGLWLCLGMQRSGGHLTTFEIDPERAATAAEWFRKAGVADRVTVVVGDAHQNVTRLRDPIDLVFLDADKEGYVDYLRTVLPLVRPGGLILAHNMNRAEGFVEYVAAIPDLDTVLLTQGSGLSVTLKKR